MTTLLEVIDEANHLLLGGMREQLTSLDGAIASDSATTINIVAGIEGLTRGDILQIEQEMVMVLDATAPAAPVVLRGYRSTAATHAGGTAVVLNPVVSWVDWVRHINNELRSLSSPQGGLFRAEPIEITYQSARLGFDLVGADDVDAVLAVYAGQPGAHGDFIPLGKRDWDLQRDMNSSSFPSGYALRLTSGYTVNGQKVRVLVKSPFALVANPTDIVESVSGIPSTAIDLLSIGAVIRAVEGNEISRNKLETNPIRKLGDVPAGALNASAAGLRSRYNERRIEERSRLIARWGL